MAIISRLGSFLVGNLDKCLGFLTLPLAFLVLHAHPGWLTSKGLLFDSLALLGLLCLAAIVILAAFLRGFLAGPYGQVIRATAKGTPGAYRPYFEGQLAALFAFAFAALASLVAWNQLPLISLQLATAALLALSVLALVGTLQLVHITVTHNHMRLRLVGMMEHWSAAVKNAASPNPT